MGGLLEYPSTLLHKARIGGDLVAGRLARNVENSAPGLDREGLQTAVNGGLGDARGSGERTC